MVLRQLTLDSLLANGSETGNGFATNGTTPSLSYYFSDKCDNIYADILSLLLTYLLNISTNLLLSFLLILFLLIQLYHN